MFISEEEARARLDSSRNFFSPNYQPDVVPEEQEDKQEEDAERAPTIGNKDIDNLLAGAVDPYKVRQRTGNLNGQYNTQVAIGTTSELLGPRIAGSLYGLSGKQSSAYNEGLSSMKDKEDGLIRNPARVARMNSVKETLAGLAAQKLQTALTSLTDSKINDCSAVKVSSIARDMATVMDKVTKDTSKPEHIHFHVFRPELKTIGEYTTVRVSSPLVINQPTEESK